jgi:hypothetical protein
VDALTQIRTADDKSIEVLVDEVVDADHRPAGGWPNILKAANVAMKKAATGDRVAVMVAHAAKRVRGFGRSHKKTKIKAVVLRGEPQVKPVVRERKENQMLKNHPADPVTYNADNLPPISAEADALLTRILGDWNCQGAESRNIVNSVGATSTRSEPLGITSDRHPTVVSR